MIFTSSPFGYPRSFALSRAHFVNGGASCRCCGQDDAYQGRATGYAVHVSQQRDAGIAEDHRDYLLKRNSFH